MKQCYIVMEKVIITFLHLTWFSLFSDGYMYISLKSSNASWSSISNEMLIYLCKNAAKSLKMKLLIYICKIYMYNFEINAQFCIYALADLNVGHICFQIQNNTVHIHHFLTFSYKNWYIDWIQENKRDLIVYIAALMTKISICLIHC